MKRLMLTMALVCAACIVGISQAKKAPPTKAKPTTPAKQTPAKEEPKVNEAANHAYKKWTVASRWNDFDVAKDALYDLIVHYPNNDSLIFSLAYFYYENQKYPSCALICKDLLGFNPKHAGALELSGISYENLNLKDKALQSYESLFLLTTNNTHLYKMASLQYDLKRYGEAQTNADILLTKPEVDSMKVRFSDNQNNMKEYKLRAAIFNLKGLIYKAQEDKENAKKSFEEALKLEPEFVMARQNLNSLK